MSLFSFHIFTVNNQYHAPNRSRPNGFGLISFAGFSATIFFNVWLRSNCNSNRFYKEMFDRKKFVKILLLISAIWFRFSLSNIHVRSNVLHPRDQNDKRTKFSTNEFSRNENVLTLVILSENWARSAGFPGEIFFNRARWKSIKRPLTTIHTEKPCQEGEKINQTYFYPSHRWDYLRICAMDKF